MVHPIDNYGFSVTVCVHSEAHFCRHSGSTSKKGNDVCVRRPPRPKGAIELSHRSVAALENEATLASALRLAVKRLYGSEPAIISWMDH